MNIRKRINAQHFSKQNLSWYGISATKNTPVFTPQNWNVFILSTDYHFFFRAAQRPVQEKIKAEEATPKTYSRYELTKLRLTQFLKDEYQVLDLPIRKINKVFIENFYLYINSSLNVN